MSPRPNANSPSRTAISARSSPRLSPMCCRPNESCAAAESQRVVAIAARRHPEVSNRSRLRRPRRRAVPSSLSTLHRRDRHWRGRRQRKRGSRIERHRREQLRCTVQRADGSLARRPLQSASTRFPRRRTGVFGLFWRARRVPAASSRSAAENSWSCMVERLQSGIGDRHPTGRRYCVEHGLIVSACRNRNESPSTVSSCDLTPSSRASATFAMSRSVALSNRCQSKCRPSVAAHRQHRHASNGRAVRGGAGHCQRMSRARPVKQATPRRETAHPQPR